MWDVAGAGAVLTCSLQVALEEIEKFLRENDKLEMTDYDYNRLLVCDPPKTKDGGNHRMYYIFRNRNEISDADGKRVERIACRTFRTLLPLLKSGAKIDLILDFTNSTHVHFFSEAEIRFYQCAARARAPFLPRHTAALPAPSHCRLPPQVPHGAQIWGQFRQYFHCVTR
jgi:hypothetical protein